LAEITLGLAGAVSGFGRIVLAIAVMMNSLMSAARAQRIDVPRARDAGRGPVVQSSSGFGLGLAVKAIVYILSPLLSVFADLPGR
jgi:hypothetical protein